MGYPQLRLCSPCSQRRCEDRGPDCDDTDICQCPCALADSADEVASFAQNLRGVPWPAEAIRA